MRLTGQRHCLIAALALAVLAPAAGFGSASAAAPAPAAPAADQAEIEGIIFDRQQLMIAIDKDAKTLGMIASGAAPAGKLAETTRAIADNAKASVEAFRAKVPGGRSKPEVWSNYVDFMQRMEAFAANTERMAKAGETNNLTAVNEIMIDALPCKQCHDVYRGPKT